MILTHLTEWCGDDIERYLLVVSRKRNMENVNARRSLTKYLLQRGHHPKSIARLIGENRSTVIHRMRSL
jgi:hypothetical protein